MTTVNDINRFIDEFAPYETHMEFDNAGFLVGDGEKQVKKVLIALDITQDVVNEAEACDAQLIVSHHPVIFRALKKIYKDDIVYSLIKNDISAICAHTNADMAFGGVNDALCEKLKLKNVHPFGKEFSKNYCKIVVFVPAGHEKDVIDAMSNAGAGTLGNYNNCSFSSRGTGSFLPCENANPFIGHAGQTEYVDEIKVEMIVPPRKINSVVKAMLNAHPYEMPAYDVFEDKAVSQDAFMGRIGELEASMTCEEFAVYVKNAVNSSAVVYTPTDKPIKTVAVCGGSASEYWHSAKKLGADAFITGEVKHHEYLQAKQCGFMLAAAGHHETENPVTEVFKNILSDAFPDVEFIIADSGDCPTRAV